MTARARTEAGVVKPSGVGRRCLEPRLAKEPLRAVPWHNIRTPCFMLIRSLASFNGSGMIPMSKALICASSCSLVRQPGNEMKSSTSSERARQFERRAGANDNALVSLTDQLFA
jgi:hypothetical protein